MGNGRTPPVSNWRRFADWAKRKPLTLQLADRLGRSRGRLRVLDHLNLKPPAPARYKPDLAGWEDHELAAIWLGHATVLLRVGGMTVLTDPVLSNRVGLGLGLATGGPKRLVAPPLSIRELPRIDLILISHAHFDHLDRPTLARLPKRIPVVTARDTSDLISDLGFRRVAELGWGESLDLGGVSVAAHPVTHWGARTFHDGHRGYNGYVLESLGSPPRRVLYGGDTAYQEYFKEIGRVDLAVLGIGAYDPYVMAHATPEQAWRMADHCRADFLLPMHHSTFRLSYEPVQEPMERLLAVAGDDEARVVVRDVGRQWALAG
jgi:L-ascorbate metabolism protein UlaG (beta-lactamase superfamily)